MTQCLRYEANEPGCGSLFKGLAVTHVGAIEMSFQHGAGGGVQIHLESDHGEFMESLVSGKGEYRASSVIVPVPVLGLQIEPATSHIVFPATDVQPQNVGIYLQNYSHYVRYAKQAWQTSSCGPVAAVAVRELRSSSGSAIVTISPRRVGVCTSAVQADPQDGFFAKPASIRITVLGPLSWSQRATNRVTNLTLPSEIATSKRLTAYRAFSDVPDTLVVKRGCKNIITATGSKGDISGGSAGTVAVGPRKSGVCVASVVDVLGQRVQSDALKINVRVMGDLSVNPYRVVSSAVLKFASAHAAPQNLTLYKTFDSEEIRPGLVANSCTATAKFDVGSGMVPTSVSVKPSSRNVAITPLASGSCIALLGDQYAGEDRIIRITVQVGQMHNPRSGSGSANSKVNNDIRR